MQNMINSYFVSVGYSVTIIFNNSKKNLLHFGSAMHLNFRQKLTFFGVLLVSSIASYANNLASSNSLYDEYPWAGTYYYGITVNDPLVRTFLLHNLDRWPEHIQSLELSHTLAPDNFLRRLVNPLVGIVQVAGNFTLRQGQKQPRIYEFAPYVAFRWANLPWNDTILTSFAIGEGISYTSSVPAIEARNNDNTKRLLNYLMFEATFAAPSYPQLQFIARIHHRSGAYGLYHAGNTGSNNIGIGLRYLFN